MVGNQVGAPQAGSRLVIQGDDIPFGAYQAIYHKLTKKVEKRHKTYNEAYTIDFNDILSLHERLCQVVKQYQVKSERCNVTQSFVDATSSEHSSFERFRMADMSSTSATKLINYEFDFLVVLPPEVPEATEIAQRYVINVRMDQDFYEKPEAIPFLFKQMIVVGQNLSLSIEYADYAVSETLLATIDGWERGLRSTKTKLALSWILKREDSIRKYIPHAASSIPIFLSIGQLRHATTIASASTVLAIAIGLGILGSPLTSLGLNKLFQESAYYRAWTYLLLTIGDSRRHADLAKKKGSGILHIILAALGVFSTIGLSVLGNYVFATLNK